MCKLNKDFLEKAYTEVNDNIKFAETKNAALITLNSALIAAGIDKVFDTEISCVWRVLIAAVVFALLIPLIISLCSFIADKGKKEGIKYSFFTGLKDKTPFKDSDDPKLMFYSYIACKCRDKETYLEKCEIRPTDDDYGLKVQLASQIVDLSSVAFSKFSLFNIAVIIESFIFAIGGLASIAIAVLNLIFNWF